jgi:hypothetical protein
VLGLTAVVPLALLDAGGGVTAGAHR